MDTVNSAEGEWECRELCEVIAFPLMYISRKVTELCDKMDHPYPQFYSPWFQLAVLNYDLKIHISSKTDHA